MTSHIITGIPVRLTTRQASVYWAQKGYPPRAISVLLGGVEPGAIRQALARARKAGDEIPRFTARRPAS
jgi:hypothetical protein